MTPNIGASATPTVSLAEADIARVLRSMLSAPAAPAEPVWAALNFFLSDSPGETVGTLAALLTGQVGSVSKEALPQVLASHMAPHWNGAPKTVRFHTSGSTGTPQAHVYPLRVLEEEARVVASQLPGRRRVINVMPPHHVFGFVFSVLLPKVMGVPVLDFPPLPLADFFDALRPGDLILAFPFFWQSTLALVAQEKDAVRLPEDLWGMTSTGVCAPEIKRGLLQLPNHKGQGLAHMAEIYGSTETSAIGIRHDLDEAYTLLPLWERISLASESKTHELTPMISRRDAQGFQAAPQALPDNVVWQDEEHFTLLDRKDKAVQVGGINVYPEQVAAFIRTHPDVKECAVRLMRPEEGVRLKAFIVPAKHCADPAFSFGKPFRQWLAANLSASACPKSLTLGEALPRNAMGKLKDW